MEFSEYLEKLDVLEKLKNASIRLPEEYRTCAMEILDRLENIYDMALIESGRYPTF
ncbi:MAG: hypothetical protein QT00_C0002G0262 [archaeon GW2011_AR5]|nr:MAG: hypothetical protein QT00_C0002G0262 [archaeon GW2011_AR5]